MKNLQSVGGVLTQHIIYKEYQSIAKSNLELKRNPKNLVLKIQFKREVTKQNIFDAMRDHNKAGSAFSHHMLVKMSQEYIIQKSLINLKQELNKISIFKNGHNESTVPMGIYKSSVSSFIHCIEIKENQSLAKQNFTRIVGNISDSK